MAGQRRRKRRSTREIWRRLKLFSHDALRGWGLSAPERRAGGEPIVLATDPDPLAHMSTREHTLAQQFN